MLNQSSINKLKGVHPDLVAVIRKAHEYTPKGPEWGIVQGARTQAQQDRLYAQGRTRPGKVVTWTRRSRHIGGYAIDFVHLLDMNHDGKLGDQEFEWKDLNAYKEIAADIKLAARDLGVKINWGGDWKNKDWGHIELDPTVYPKGSTASHMKPPPPPIPVQVKIPPFGNDAHPLNDLVVPTEILQYMMGKETFQTKPYWDGNRYSWGYGTEAPGPTGEITKEQAYKDFIQHVEDEAMKYIRRYIKVPLTMWQFGALICLVYNYGIGNFINSHIDELVNQNKHTEAADEILKCVPPEGTLYHNGILARRKDERNFYLRTK